MVENRDLFSQEREQNQKEEKEGLTFLFCAVNIVNKSVNNSDTDPVSIVNTVNTQASPGGSPQSPPFHHNQHRTYKTIIQQSVILRHLHAGSAENTPTSALSNRPTEPTKKSTLVKCRKLRNASAEKLENSHALVNKFMNKGRWQQNKTTNAIVL